MIFPSSDISGMSVLFVIVSCTGKMFRAIILCVILAVAVAFAPSAKWARQVCCCKCFYFNFIFNTSLLMMDLAYIVE